MPYRPALAAVDQVRPGETVEQPAGLGQVGAGQRGGGVRVEVVGPGAGRAAGTSRAASAAGAGTTRRTRARTAAPASPPASSRSSRPRWSASSATRSASGIAGRAAASSAATRSASGRRAHCSASAAAACGSASTRAPTQRGAAGRVASVGGQQVEVDAGGRRRAATSPARLSRLVTTRSSGPVPGSSGRTCSTEWRVVQHDQHPPAGQLGAVAGGALVHVHAGCPRPVTPSALRNPASASAGSSAGRGRSRAGRRRAGRRGTGRRTRCAQCTASAVLPTPAVPADRRDDHRGGRPVGGGGQGV